MRRLLVVLAAALLGSACTPPPPVVPPPPPLPLPGAPILVVPLGTKLVTLELLDCTPTLPTTGVPVTISNPAVDNNVHDGAGDVLVVRSGGAKLNTSVALHRQGGTNRQVDASATDAVTKADITLDVTDCNVAKPYVTVVRQAGAGIWEDVGDGKGVKTTGTRRTVSTGTLDHLSIYALAGG